ncbi:MAG: YeeE/YedE family protein [Filomicrobium sp.]
MRDLAALLAGIVFGLGMTVSGMINPVKVLNFFDFAGTWDPSLGVVFACALATTAVGYHLVFRFDRPLLDETFHLPIATNIDRSLVLGSVLYGVGWGIVGFCPGNLMPAMGLFHNGPWIFVGGLIAGLAIARYAQMRLAELNSATPGAA